jgi:thiol-disulfide isomerase/thioredoxin
MERVTASPEALYERHERGKPAERWSGIVLAVLMLAALGLAGRNIWSIATGPLPPGKGVTAPAFSAVNMAGQKVELAGLKSNVVLVDFWATWCPPCVASMPHLQKIQDDYRGKGVIVLGVNQEPGEEEKVRRFLAQRNLTFPTVMDPGSIHVEYGVYSFPTTFVLDRQGVIRSIFRGPASEKALRAAIEPLL